MPQPMTLATPHYQQQPRARFVRKRYPLMHLGLGIRFMYESGDQAFDLVTCDLSDEELRLNCFASHIPRLVPRTAHHNPDEKIFHDALLFLNEQESIPVRLQVSFCRRFSQKEFKVGFFISELDEVSMGRLQQRLELALAQNVRPASVLN